jgi:hypothetical protein
MKTYTIAAIITLALMSLVACGSSLDGTYADKSGSIKYTFDSDGTVQYEMMGMARMELKYEVDGDEIKIFSEGGGPALIMTIKEDGSIVGGMGIILTLQD